MEGVILYTKLQKQLAGNSKKLVLCKVLTIILKYFNLTLYYYLI